MQPQIFLNVPMPRPCLLLRMFPYLLLWHLSYARPDFDRCVCLLLCVFLQNNVHEANADECFDSGFALDPRSFEQSPRILRMNPSGNNCESTFILLCLFFSILDHSLCIFRRPWYTLKFRPPLAPVPLSLTGHLVFHMVMPRSQTQTLHIQVQAEFTARSA